MAFKKKTDDKFLDVDASMQGTLHFKDPVNLRINGRFEGHLETRGNLTIGQAANVNADIIGDTIVIEGRVKGRIIAKEILMLAGTAVVEGEIIPVKLSISEGGIFEGKCTMLADFLNPEELARYLEVEVNSVLEWANAGKIPASKQGNDWKFERKAVDTWVSAGKVAK